MIEARIQRDELRMNSPPSHNLPYTKLLHENFSVIMTYAFSEPVLARLLNSRFHGEWKYLCKVCFEISGQRANRALLELALQLRLIDAKENLSTYFTLIIEATGRAPSHGKIIKKDGTEVDLSFREITNKILHSSGIEWEFDDPDNPVIICYLDEPSQWVRAEIQVLCLAALVGGFMS
jgi:hypothetical protein